MRPPPAYMLLLGWLAFALAVADWVRERRMSLRDLTANGR